jgi:hypothetical protein
MYLRACLTCLWSSCAHPQDIVVVDLVRNIDPSTDVLTVARLACEGLDLLPEFVHLHHKGDLLADKLLLRQVDLTSSCDSIGRSHLAQAC